MEAAARYIEQQGGELPPPPGLETSDLGKKYVAISHRDDSDPSGRIRPGIAASAIPHGPAEYIADTGTTYFVMPADEMSSKMRKRIKKLENPITSRR